MNKPNQPDATSTGHDKAGPPARDKSQPPDSEKPPVSDGDAIAELGDEVGGPA